MEHVEESGDVAMGDQKVRKVANAIIKIIKKTLVAFMNILTNLGLMMQKVMVDPIVRDVIPNPINMVKDAFQRRNS